MRRNGVSLGLVLVCTCLALGLAAASAFAAPAWLPPEDISASNEVVDGRPKVAVDPAGNAVAIWERTSGGEEIVEATERPAGGEWSAPETLTLPGEEGEATQVAIDAAGNAVAVWMAKSSPTVIRTATRPAGGEWSEPEDLSADDEDAEAPQVAVNGAGDAVAVWRRFDGTDFIVQAATRPAGGEWSESDDLSAVGQDAEVPQVAIDEKGDAVAVWRRSNGANFIVQAAVLPAGGEWSEPEDISVAGRNAREPQVAVDPEGNAVAVWHRSNGSNFIVQAALLPAGGEWSEPDDLSAAGEEAEESDVAIDETGDAVAVWKRFNGANFIVQAALLPAGGEWSEPDDLSAPGQNGLDPVVAANDALGAVALWWRFDGSNSRVQASVRPVGGEWSEPDDLSAEGEGAGFPDVALDAAGDAIAVFGRNGDDGLFAQATGYDFAAPQLNDLRIPAGGTAGEPVSFSVSPFDVFPLGTTTWTFGDGGPDASGNAVSHTFSKPGTYPVTVRAVDGSGNASTRTAPIRIVAGPIPPPPPTRIALSLRLGSTTLARLLRSGKLVVAVTVSKPARVVLNGQAKLRPRGKGKPRFVTVFKKKTINFSSTGGRKVKLRLTRQGRNALEELDAVKLRVTSRATDLGGETATRALRRTLRS
ncbi:MAG TPA: PKD domain-containing protein [Solirubrobacterales bacterium]|nr:PKD domain-containing protein [Solirubrobacterales bacterium]